MINQYSEVKEDEELVEEEEKEPLAPMLKMGFSIVGVVCCLFVLVGGVLTFINSCKVLRYKEIETTVGDGYFIEDTRYNLDYEVDGNEYRQDFLFKKELKEGDKVKAYYDPKNPEHLALKKMVNITAIVAAIISAFALKKLFPLVFKYKKETKAYYKEIEEADEDEE